MLRMKSVDRLKKQCVLAGVGAALALSGTASALDYELWLPYLRAHDHGSVAPFGDANSDSMYQLPDLTDPNYIWNTTQVSTGSGGKSYFDQTHSQKRWRIVIHNKMTTSRSVSLRFKSAADGSAVTKTTKWNFVTPPGTLPNYLDGTFPAGYTWDSGNNEIDFTIAGETTKVIEMDDLVNISTWSDKSNFASLSTPYISTSAYFAATAQLVVRSATSEEDVSMYVDGWDVYRPRAHVSNEATFSFDQTDVAQWGYQAFVKEDSATGAQSGKLIFPYYKQVYRQNFSSPTIHVQQSESFFVFLTNAHSSSDTLLIKAWAKDGSGLYGEHYVTLAPYEEFTLQASQLLWGSGQFEGYIEIFGKNPIGVGFNVKYGRAWTVSGSKAFQSPNFLVVSPISDLVNCCTNPCNLAYCFGGLN